MSRENVVKFIDAVERDESLRNRLLQESQGTSGWIEAAGAPAFRSLPTNCHRQWSS